LKAMPVPICSIEEQRELNRVLDEQLSQVDAMETEITTALARIAALRQAILKQAFSGRLVPQDPADEPASALLARLREPAPPTRARRKTSA
jgi:type I restriction enzyme S subunit